MPLSRLASGEVNEFYKKEAHFNLNVTNVKHNVRGAVWVAK